MPRIDNPVTITYLGNPSGAYFKVAPIIAPSATKHTMANNINLVAFMLRELYHGKP